jgi:hypothetical protein
VGRLHTLSKLTPVATFGSITPGVLLSSVTY